MPPQLKDIVTYVMVVGKKVERVRQSKDDYFRTALDLLADGGVDALTIANLCARLGVTTGSFYAHFAGIREFHIAFLEQWEVGRVYLLKEQVEFTTDPLERIDLLRRLAVAVNHEAESAIRGWARTNPLVADFQRRVDRTREEALVQAFLDIGIDDNEARVLARIGLTILVGTQQIEEKVDRQRLDDLLSEYQRWLGIRRQGSGTAVTRGRTATKAKRKTKAKSDEPSRGRL
jgi:AcrR family transcriptional regulator